MPAYNYRIGYAPSTDKIFIHRNGSGSDKEDRTDDFIFTLLRFIPPGSYRPVKDKDGTTYRVSVKVEKE